MEYGWSCHPKSPCTDNLCSLKRLPLEALFLLCCVTIIKVPVFFSWKRRIQKGSSIKTMCISFSFSSLLECDLRRSAWHLITSSTHYSTPSSSATRQMQYMEVTTFYPKPKGATWMVCLFYCTLQHILPFFFYYSSWFFNGSCTYHCTSSIQRAIQVSH